ncbi:cytochrome c biogenesis protein CcsA [Fulvivirga sedimenti]|uniref:Heme exporter protein C n=1 Tax=Fulvivirga sedimenti TaxID=2879465 RepID=A0A9X1L0W6_9BACT|nr:cytochrome c biogenesis protein CcsA [Fulvivirga sedimenti]MCA6078259.1 cytochrome c biogenesis protein [Fulvivirga sedimenti]
MRSIWWKIATVLLLIYVAFTSLLMEAPRLNILNETVRVLHYHVPMWFGMLILFLVSVIYSIKYLRNGRNDDDLMAVEFANVAIVLGILGILTGMVWAQFTWGDWWSGDPKQNAAAIGLMIYLAYFVLRGSFENEEQRGRISAVYNIFAFAALVPLLFILPRLTDSLHPGNGGNPGFNAYDLDNRLRMVFYPAVIGWSLLGVWIATLRFRIRKIQSKLI